jgi:hypothetical protein
MACRLYRYMNLGAQGHVDASRAGRRNGPPMRGNRYPARALPDGMGLCAGGDALEEAFGALHPSFRPPQCPPVPASSVPQVFMLPIGTAASPLGHDFGRKRLGHNLAVLQDEGVGAQLVAVIRRLRLHDVGRIAFDLLPEHLEGRSRLGELREQLLEEAPNRLGATQEALRGEKFRLRVKSAMVLTTSPKLLE